MVKPHYIVRNGQSLFDVAIHLFGHQDGAFSLLLDNPGVDHAPLYPGQKLFYTPVELNKDVLKYIKQKNYHPATAGEMSDAPIPEVEPPLMINVTEVSGEVHAVEAGSDVSCQWPILVLLDESESIVITPIMNYPPAGIIIAPDAEVRLNGVHYDNVRSGGMIDVISPVAPEPEGYRYVDVIQSNLKTVSYAAFDHGWQIANNIYDRAHPSNPIIHAALDMQPANPAHAGYLLKDNNLHGHKWRYTTVDGHYCDGSSWHDLDGDEVFVFNMIIFDHLLGRKLFRRITGLTGINIVSPSATWGGENGWRNSSVDDLHALKVEGYTGLNYAISQYESLWTSFIVSPTQAIIYKADVSMENRYGLQAINVGIWGQIIWKYF